MASVFLVDDHPDLAEVIRQLLELHGHSVVTFQSAELAQQALTSERPDALITDERLPGMSGMDLLRRVQAEPSLDQLPVIICSADDTNREIALRCGAFAFWLKGSDQLFDGVAGLAQQLG